MGGGHLVFGITSWLWDPSFFSIVFFYDFVLKGSAHHKAKPFQKQWTLGKEEHCLLSWDWSKPLLSHPSAHIPCPWALPEVQNSMRSCKRQRGPLLWVLPACPGSCFRSCPVASQGCLAEPPGAIHVIYMSYGSYLTVPSSTFCTALKFSLPICSL